MPKQKLLQVTMDLGNGKVWWLIPTSFPTVDALWEALLAVGQDSPRRRGNGVWATLADLDRAEDFGERK